jgi:hypothetical protein
MNIGNHVFVLSPAGRWIACAWSKEERSRTCEVGKDADEAPEGTAGHDCLAFSLIAPY